MSRDDALFLDILHPLVPWREIIGMRNRLIHEYFRVDLEEVWSTVMKDIPPLVAEVEKLVQAEE